MKFMLTIETNNAAFEGHPGPEMARVLRTIADYTEDGSLWAMRDAGRITDSNGNRVGEWRVVSDKA